MHEAYTHAIQQHVNESVEDLEALHQIMLERSWSRIERKGAERLVQALVESCIGVSKHWLKQQHKVVPNDAYSVFEKLTELQLIPANEIQDWQRIIGMRNAIVHDYLNLDDKVIKAIVKNKMYLKLQSFALHASEQLNVS